jgi:hypothetical protein
MVPVDPDFDSLASQLAAVQSASGTGALVTLLHIDERRARLMPSVQLDAVGNLHQMLFVPPEEATIAPAYPEKPLRKELKRLQAMRDRLMAVGPEGAHVRVAYRRGDAPAEAAAFIDDAGVDVVFLQSPASCRSATLRRLARTLQRGCACQIHIVHPPTARAVDRGWFNQWWNSLVASWRKRKRPASPAGTLRPDA